MCYENENRNLRSTFKNELDFECSFYAIYNKMFRILIEVKSSVWINLCSGMKNNVALENPSVAAPTLKCSS